MDALENRVRKEPAVWLCIDRIEAETVVLLDDGERVYHLSVEDYTALTGLPPRESDVLTAEVEGDRVVYAAYDGEETQKRKDAARARLNRLFGRK